MHCEWRSYKMLRMVMALHKTAGQLDELHPFSINGSYLDMLKYMSVLVSRLSQDVL